MQKKIKNDRYILLISWISLLETNNDLSSDGYENINVVRGISPPDLAFLRMIEKIEPGNKEADRNERDISLEILIIF